MTTMQMPKGEKMQRAIKWISGRLEDEDSRPSAKLIEEACREFNLSPTEEEFLMSFYKKK
ncbi:MAG: hypothetical protein JXC33_07370 [Deltaproteobacteria bacterium]|nr:hypothetical protein [Deltaproteobacteria bacterium]